MRSRSADRRFKIYCRAPRRLRWRHARPPDRCRSLSRAVRARLRSLDIARDQRGRRRPPRTDTAEFLELKNVSSAAINLDPYSVESSTATGAGRRSIRRRASGLRLAAGDHYVVCASPATTPNCDLDVTPETDLIQNGDPDALGLRLGMTLVDAVSYEGNSGAPYTEGSGAGTDDATDGISRCPDGTDTDRNNVDFILRPITPGAANSCPPPPPFGSAATGRKRLSTTSRAPARRPPGWPPVRHRGRRRRRLPGFGGPGRLLRPGRGRRRRYGSEDVGGPVRGKREPGRRGRRRPRPGDCGRVLRQDAARQRDEPRGLPGGGVGQPTTVALPVTSLEEWEKYEGMLVTLPQSLSIGEYFDFDRFNEIVLTDGRQYQPTAVHEPGSAEAAELAESNPLGRMTLDDGRNSQNPNPAIHPNGAMFDLRIGSAAATRWRTSPACWTSPSASTGSSRPREPTTAPPTRAGRAGGRRRQPHRRLVQRPQLLHDAGPPRRQHPGGVPAAAGKDHRGDHETRRRRRRADRDREQRRGDRGPRRRPQRRERRGHVRLHRHGRDRHGRDQGRVHLQAGTRDAGRRPRDPRLVGRPALHRHAEPSGPGTDIPVARERRRVHRGRQPPQVEGLGLQRRRRSRHRRRIRQLQPHAHVRGRGARRLARDAIRPAAATTTS